MQRDTHIKCSVTQLLHPAQLQGRRMKGTEKRSWGRVN